MASPVVLIYTLPLGVGMGLDVFALPSDRLVAFAVWGVAGIMVLRHLLRQLPLQPTVPDPRLREAEAAN